MNRKYSERLILHVHEWMARAQRRSPDSSARPAPESGRRPEPTPAHAGATPTRLRSSEDTKVRQMIRGTCAMLKKERVAAAVRLPPPKRVLSPESSSSS